MLVTSEGSVRVDLVGGTLDLEPINLILPHVVTLNVATSLKAKVELELTDKDSIVIESLDYHKSYEFSSKELTDSNLYYSNYFKEMSFVLQIIDLFGIRSGLHIKLSSGAPAGSGLGGSSAMGMTLFKALTELKNLRFDTHLAVLKVKGVEGRILNQGVPGYQDYYPAMVGGILALRGVPGEIRYEQLYTPELKSFLEKHITLVFSGISRDSGINNWEVYKGFFDGKEDIRHGLSTIADISHQTYLAIKHKEYNKILELIGKEGESRKNLAPAIVPQEVSQCYENLKEKNLVEGIKMCGAGGGGCFILTHQADQGEAVREAVQACNFQVLDFHIEQPL